MTKDFFYENIADTLPHAPGIYKYFDKSQKIIYVGKAKDLKKRVTSYFAQPSENKKTRTLVDNIERLEWVITDSEHDAFLLENSLIKHFKPRFNINLKDDKTYPYVVIKNEPFPRVFLTRNIIKDGSEYIGPFTSVWRVRELLNLIRETIPLRTCGLNLSQENIRKGKFKVCLEYHLGNCNGPCENLQSEEAYDKSIQLVRSILKGNLSTTIQALKDEMKHYSDALQFEKSQLIKNRIEALKNYESKSVVVSTTIEDVDVASIIMDDESAIVNYMMVTQGQVLQSKSLVLQRKLEELPEEVLSYAISVLRNKFQSQAKEIIAPIQIFSDNESIKITIPKLGEKKKLLELSFKNATYFKEENEKKKRLLIGAKTEEQHQEILDQLQMDLKLNELPSHIECFDNSNFQGSYPVAAMVCFKDGKPSNKDYRHFHIKTVKGINDFASMEEIVHRRYKRLLDEKKPLPQLVIIDGGKGQLGAAMKSIEKLGLIGSMTVVGLAKRVEEIFYPGDNESLKLPFNGKSMLLIRYIRDEVHRFGITFHRNTRSKGTFKTELNDIKGIGEKTIQTLLQTYRSVSKIKTLSLEQLSKTIDIAKAKIIFEYFQNQKSQ